MLELGAIGALTIMLVELGKRKMPNVFVSEVNALLSVAIFTLLNAANAYYFGGDVSAAISDGIIEGLAVTGAYRAISKISKTNSIDLSEQVSLGGPDEEHDHGDKNDTVVKGFGK